MSLKVEFTPETEADLAEAYSWYEAHRDGLGEEFLSCVDAALQLAERYPLACPRVYENFRRTLTRRFPYAIFYEVEADSLVVYAVFHTSQDPEKWRRRIGQS